MEPMMTERWLTNQSLEDQVEIEESEFDGNYPRVTHSRSEYERLQSQGVDVLPPEEGEEGEEEDYD